MENLYRNLEVLIKVVTRINKNINYVLSGSTSLAFQGVELEPNDIDIFTDKEGVDYLHNILSEYMLEKPTKKDTTVATSYYCKCIIEGVQVEIIGDFITKKEDGSYNDTIINFDDVIYKEYKGIKIPLLSLEKELLGYKALNREEKVKKIEAAIINMHN